jgi:hypothetical protein
MRCVSKCSSAEIYRETLFSFDINHIPKVLAEGAPKDNRVAMLPNNQLGGRGNNRFLASGFAAI